MHYDAPVFNEAYLRFSPQLSRLRHEAYRRGFLEGRAGVIVEILEGRGIVMKSADRDFILACRDIDTIDKWADRALNVSEISELFAD